MLGNIFYRSYSFLFARKIFTRFNTILFNASLRGMGILNYHTMKESGEIFFLNKFCRYADDPVIIDVGSNTGMYATHLKRLNPNATIYAFEPHPRTFEQLQQTSRLHHFNAYPLACGTKTGSQKFYDYNNNEGSEHASLYKEVIEAIHHQPASEWDVNMITLDDFINEKCIHRIHLLKIDTEGHELPVLQGAKKTLKENRIDIIHFEFNEMNVISRTFFKDFFDLLGNYSFYRLVRDGFVPIRNYQPLACELFAYQNIITIRNDIDFNP